MILGIDASNIRTGGGKKHLDIFIRNTISLYSDVEIILVSNESIISSYKSLNKVKCISNPLLNLSNLSAFLSQLFFSKKYFKKNKCDIVFVPGGIFISSFKPYITMSQNMLPFSPKALHNFSFIGRIKFNIIGFFQILTFKRSNGIIFLNQFAKDIISAKLSSKMKYKIIPHGINQEQNILFNNIHDKFKILYVSDFLPYKHQLNVIKSVKELIQEGYNLKLTLIGRIKEKYLKKIKKEIPENLLKEKKIEILGFVPNEKILKFYRESSLKIFASTCENLPFVLLEAMSFGMPIITSNERPMRDMIYGKDVLFDSHNIQSIKSTILNNMNPEKLEIMSSKNYQLSKNYSWKKNVDQTIEFLKSCAN